jgi:hypothetical protein
MFNNKHEPTNSNSVDVPNNINLTPEMFEEQPTDILKSYMGYFRNNDNSTRIMKVCSNNVEDTWD